MESTDVRTHTHLRGLSRSCLCPFGGLSFTSFVGVSQSHSLGNERERVLGREPASVACRAHTACNYDVFRVCASVNSIGAHFISFS